MFKSLLITLALASSANDLANERFIVSAEEIEKHWKVDCRAMVQQWNKLFTEQSGNSGTITPAELDVMLVTSEKCAFIYNTEGTGRTVPCPDYQSINQHLLLMRENSDYRIPADANASLCKWP
jgi:hypothetical protein